MAKLARTFGSTAVFSALIVGCNTIEPETILPVTKNEDHITYEHKKYLPGIDSVVTVKKTPTSISYASENGTNLSPAELNRLDRERFRTKYGAATKSFFDFASTRGQGDTVDALVMFDAHIPWIELRPHIAGNQGESARQSALQEIGNAIESAKAPIIDKLTKLGISVSSSYKTIPALIIKGSPEAILRAAHFENITRVQGAAPMRAEPYSAKNGVTDSSIDTSFNASGYFGLGQKIGNFETVEEGLYDSHESFALAEPDPSNGYRVTYQIEPKDCTTDADCNAITSKCLSLGHSGHPKQCVSAHATKAMSVAAGAVGGVPYGASKSRYYVSNRGDGTTYSVQCRLSAEIDAYEWFIENGVTTVNESYGCYGMYVPGETNPLRAGAFGEGTVQDWYARNYDIFISKAAGNQAEGPRDPACPYTKNSLCVGSTILNAARMSCTSNWTNNSIYPNGDRSDREEPDVVAFGSESGDCAEPGVARVDVADISGSTTSWTQGTGTSFAAPQLAALGALCKEAAGGFLDQRSVRAIMQVSGFSRNVEAYNYSTPSTNLSLPDWKDGGGAVSAPIALGICGGESMPDPNLTGGTWSSPGELDGTTWDYDNSDCPQCNVSDPPFGGLSVTPLSADAAGSSTRKYATIDRFELHEGDRLRYVIAWDSCPEAANGWGAPPTATDYDLFLVKYTTPVYSSQSVDDTTEGFDVTIGPGDDDTYSIVLGFPSDSVGCRSDRYEPYSVAWLTETRR